MKQIGQSFSTTDHVCLTTNATVQMHMIRSMTNQLFLPMPKIHITPRKVQAV